MVLNEGLGTGESHGCFEQVNCVDALSALFEVSAIKKTERFGYNSKYKKRYTKRLKQSSANRDLFNHHLLAALAPAAISRRGCTRNILKFS